MQQQAITDIIDAVERLVELGMPLEEATKLVSDLVAIGKRCAAFTPECQMAVDQIRARRRIAEKAA
jgi:hypothetical protein